MEAYQENDLQSQSSAKPAGSNFDPITAQRSQIADRRPVSDRTRILQNKIFGSARVNSLGVLQQAVNREVSQPVLQMENEALASAAEDLEDKFNWTLPGGLLEYKVIIEDWQHYRNVLLDQTSPATLNYVNDLCRKIDQLLHDKSDGYITTVKSVLDDIKSHLSVTLSNDGGEDMVKLTDDFSLWLSTGWEPSHMNCWEAVIYASVQAGIVTKGEMLAYIKKSAVENGWKTDSEHLFRKFLLGRSREDLIEAEWEEDIPDHEDPTSAKRGDVLCFWEDASISHVAIHTGPDECMSLWAGDTLHFQKTSVTGLLSKYKTPHLEIIKV